MAYKQRVENLFKLLDGNNNGTIEKADTEAVYKASMRIMKVENVITPAQQEDIKTAISSMIEGIIKSGGGEDKKATQAEFLAIIEKHFIGKPYKDAPAWYKKSIDSIFSAMDRNSDGVISEAEFVEFFAASIPAISADMVKAAYQQVTGILDRKSFRNLTWNWVTNTEPMVQDVMLTIAVSNLNG